MKSFFSHTTYAADEPGLLAKDNDEKRLLQDLKLARTELEIAYSGFDNVTDPDLIDCYIYEVNSALKRYRFFIYSRQNKCSFMKSIIWILPNATTANHLWNSP